MASDPRSSRRRRSFSESVKPQGQFIRGEEGGGFEFFSPWPRVSEMEGLASEEDGS